MYAVYHLLEHYLGCGFFEDGDQIPERSAVEIKEMNIVERPHFEWRIYFSIQDTYSGMRWWNWDQFRFWVDWLVKKRYNMWDSEHLLDNLHCGILPEAATKMCVPMQSNAWQRARRKIDAPGP